MKKYPEDLYINNFLLINLYYDNNSKLAILEYSLPNRLTHGFFFYNYDGLFMKGYNNNGMEYSHWLEIFNDYNIINKYYL